MFTKAERRVKRELDEINNNSLNYVIIRPAEMTNLFNLDLVLLAPVDSIAHLYYLLNFI